MRPLIRFHWSSGVRVALRVNALLIGIVVFLFGSAPLPRVALHGFVIGTLSSRALVSQRLLFVAICAGMAAVAAPRVTLGSAGWMRSLPVSGWAVRVAAALALVAAQAAGFVFLALALPLARLVYHVPVSWTLLAGDLVAITAIALAAVPGPWSSRVLAAGAVLASIMGTAAGVAAAVLLVLVAAAVPGGVQVRGRKAAVRRQRRRQRAGRRMQTGLALWQRMLWRGIGVRRVAAAAVLPAIFCAYAYVILRNNSDLSPGETNTVVRWCGGIALVLLATGIASSLAVTRQPWPWARSLPWSSWQRVFLDARSIAIPLVVVVAVLAPLGGWGALCAAAAIPLVSFAGAAALRSNAERVTGASGETMIVAGATAVAIAIWPLVALLALALAPLAAREAVARERRLRVTAWRELGHDGQGDPLWSGTSA